MENNKVQTILEELKKEFPDMTWSLNEQSMTILAEKGNFYFCVCYREIPEYILLDYIKYNLHGMHPQMEQEK